MKIKVIIPPELNTLAEGNTPDINLIEKGIMSSTLGVRTTTPRVNRHKKKVITVKWDKFHVKKSVSLITQIVSIYVQYLP